MTVRNLEVAERVLDGLLTARRGELAGRRDAGAALPVLVVAAHPDDEVIGVGAQLERWPGALVLHVTDGAPRDGRAAKAHGLESPAAYARVRRADLERALALAGVTPSQLLELRCPDQEASLRLVDITRQLAALLGEIRPTAVITHPYEGGHPDHDATAFAVHAAVRLLGDEEPGPVLVEMTSYHRGPSGIRTGAFLPSDHARCSARWVTLTAEQRARKERMLACFTTEQEMLSQFPVDVEGLRLAPAYDFTDPPHAGTLFYELFPWGMSGEEFRAHAREALRTLGLEGGAWA